MATLAQTLEKKMARLSAITEKMEAVKSGKPLRLKTAVNNLERNQRALERSRVSYIKEILTTRNEVLGKEIPMDEIAEGRKIAEKVIEESRTIFTDGWKRKALLSFELLICEIKEMVADVNVDLVIQACEDYDDFLEGLKEYTAATIAQGLPIDVEKIKDLWAIEMPEKNVKALSRTSTPFGAIDVFRYDAVRGINSSDSPEKAQEVVNEFVKQVNLRFQSWGLPFQIPVNSKE